MECRCCLLGCHVCMATVPDNSQVPVVIIAYERVGCCLGWLDPVTGDITSAPAHLGCQYC